MSLQAVVVDRYPWPERGLVAAVLAQHAGVPEPVARKLAQRAGGIVWENAPQPAAEAVARAMSAQGSPARTIDQSCVPTLGQPRRVHVLKLDDEHLGIPLKYNGPPEWVAWNDVLVISCGAFKTETTRTIQTQTHLIHGEIVSDERVQVDLTRSIAADLFAVPLADRTQLLHVRLSSDEFNYALTMGSTIHESWREKFAVLIAKLGLRAERALISPQTEALLAAGMLPQNCPVDSYFDSDEEFAAYNRWLVARARAGIK
ncbi:MAG: hypothetical protein L0211_20670 [Planctomycetaceae bacterium]|nr:hypothetical protein [Planctomycetaceae bacterium]